MDFLNHGEGVIVFYQVFLLSPLQCTVTNCRNLCEFEEIEISMQREVTVNSKEENCCLYFVLEFGLRFETSRNCRTTEQVSHKKA
jgi:hypothetical protein